ncbi:hypothetical protein E2562_015732 [Oryza meyeriana var. granulata]|uniref:Mitochondrial import inner membrane translocase subunit TIM17 n=1 Tax=Oryza meyeriana var. granulata TaxID=110450 RepID=A0A6G1D304_9ORYZ|nr:hypothetical protein E2562_015732 [Oryza meyeriana var. granulata]
MQQSRLIMERDPCPDRIIDDIGVAFGMGAVGGSFFHFVKGLRNSPNGARIAGGMQAVLMNAPRVAGSFAVWGGLFSACDCAVVFARQKEDPYNAIIAGAATGGILSARQGLRAVVGSSLTGAVYLALFSGFGIMMNSLPVPGTGSVLIDDPFTVDPVPNTGSIPVDDPFSPHVEKSHVGGHLMDYFRRRVEGGATNSSNKTETLETLDVPSVPTPSYEYN